MSGFVNFIRGLDWSYLTDLVISVIPALLCISVHEMCHGLAAYRLGDDTPETQGRLSLNPLRHIDVMGLLMLVVFKFGWAKPVRVDARNFKHPKRDMAITALAGPASNLVLAALLLAVYGFLYPLLYDGSVGAVVLRLVYTTAYLSVCLCIFNLIPIPPLDGSKVLFAFLPDRQYGQLMRYEKYGMILLLVVMLSGVADGYISAASGFVFGWVFKIAELTFKLGLRVF